MLDAKGYEVTNYGTDTERVDYPDFAHPVASDVAEGRIMELLFAGGRQVQ
jgi:ribose 5-phosphate isomerase B